MNKNIFNVGVKFMRPQVLGEGKTCVAEKKGVRPLMC